MLYLRTEAAAYCCVNVISHLQNVGGLVGAVNDIMLLAQLVNTLICIRKI